MAAPPAPIGLTRRDLRLQSVADRIELSERLSVFVLSDVAGSAMTAKEAVEDPSVAARYEELLATHLGFYEALRLRERRPRSAAQRQFQDVAWGRAEPASEHEKAYVWHLRRRRIAPFNTGTPSQHIDDAMTGFEPGSRPVSSEAGVKWDNAWREIRGGREFW
ncbi:MAG TPA: hypothetical protein QF469_13880 [Sphingomonas sanguinis]|jgi:hypothetical protein|nr:MULTISPECIES: hypothetical protein [Sphingomonas]MCT7997576.1 hypothetical protein [Laspinema sp. D3c]HJO66415.1 hypothetical protein [Sphingomonas sanguinis]